MKKCVLFLIIALMLLAAAPAAYAEQGESSFLVGPQYPGNQLEPDTGYFYISMEPGATQTLTAVAVNNSDADIELFIESADAYTSPAGELVYITGSASADMGYTDDKFMLSGAIKTSASSITLNPGETAPVEITVTAPSIESGEAIGAVRFYTMEKGEAQGQSSGVEINVKSAQTIPVRIRIGQQQAVSNPSMTVGNVEFDSVQSKFYFTVQNDLAAIGKLDKLIADVSSPGGSVYKSEIGPVKAAPKTFWRMYLDLAGTPPGTYAVNIALEYQGSVKNETREFTIEAAQASALPEASVSPSPGAPPPGGVFIKTEYVIAFGAVAVAVFIVLFIRPKRRR